jgi:hypothetical protein
MKMTDMRAKARAIFGPANPEPMPNQPNGAKALQERANARPIPTYKVGGSVKKPTPPQPTAAEREAERKRRESLANTKVTQSEADTLGRAMRSEGPRYKHGGKAAPASPNKIPKTGKKITMPPPDISMPLSSDELERRYDRQREIMLDNSGMKHGGKVQTASDTARKLATEMGGMKNGGAMKPVDEAKNPGLKKLPTEVRNKMGYMKKGGKPKDGLAVMIAIGSPMKKSGKKMMDGGSTPMVKTSNLMAKGGMKKPMMKADGGDIVVDRRPVQLPTRREVRDERNLNKRAEGGAMKPVKKAAGGAAKVRKGMMTPEGVITHAMNKIRGK